MYQNISSDLRNCEHVTQNKISIHQLQRQISYYLHTRRYALIYNKNLLFRLRFDAENYRIIRFTYTYIQY